MTDKEKLFVKYYAKHRNATKAAILAGYSKDSAYSTGWDILKKPEIKAAIDKELAERMAQIQIDTTMVLEELKKVGFANIKDLARWGNGTVDFKPSEEVDEDLSAAVAEVSENTTEFGHNLKLRMHDKLKALELLGKYLKMWTEKHEHTGKDGQPLIPKSLVDIVKTVAKNAKSK